MVEAVDGAIDKVEVKLGDEVVDDVVEGVEDFMDDVDVVDDKDDLMDDVDDVVDEGGGMDVAVGPGADPACMHSLDVEAFDC